MSRNNFHTKQKLQNIFPSIGRNIPLYRKGNGITLFGSSLIIVVLLLLYLLIRVFVIYHQSSAVQQAVDSIADSVAVYMAIDGENYSDATYKANELAGQIKDYTGVDVGTVTVDKEALDDNTVQVTASVQHIVNPLLKGDESIPYTIRRTAATEYKEIGTLREQICSFALQWVDTLEYVPGGVNGSPNFYVGADCTGFMYLIFGHFGIYVSSGSDGYLSPYVNTFGTVFYDPGSLLPGDIICYESTPGSTYHAASHVGLYLGNGMVVHSSYSAKKVVTSVNYLGLAGGYHHFVRVRGLD